MNSGAIKSSVGRCASICKYSVLVFVMGLMSSQAVAATVDAQFRQYLHDICFAASPPPSPNLGDLATLCLQAFPGGGASSPPATISSNLGTVNAGGGAVARKKKGIRVSLEDQKAKPDKGASADGGGWGFLMTPQYSNSNRSATDLENGYQADLTGLVVGLDYRFTDGFVMGVAVGQTKDKANFNSNAGFLKTSNNTATLYGTWLYSESVSVDGYLGYGKLNLDNQRQLVFGSQISGTMTSSATGQQTMAGMSASYQMEVGRFNFAPSLNLDYVKTSINSYNDSGSNVNASLIALHYGDRKVTSLTSSLGGRLSTSYGYDWGSFQPSARLAAVHEFQNRTRQISNALVLAPTTPFSVETDAPDRNYLNLGLGVSAALNGGTQLFLDYDKRAQDKLLSSWAVSLGVLTEF